MQTPSPGKHSKDSSSSEDEEPPRKKGRSTSGTEDALRRYKSQATALKEEVENLKEDNARLKEDKEVLEQVVEGLKNAPAPKSRRDKIPQELREPLKLAIQDSVWAKAPVLSSKTDRDKFAQAVAKASDLPMFGHTDKDHRANITKFVHTYSNGVIQLLNEKRSGAVGNIKKRVMDEFAQHVGHEIPALDKILKVVGRDPKCDIATFAWWWDTILPAVTGRDSFWNNQVRYYTTICKHMHNVNGKSTHCITPQLEAFALLTVESNRSKWTKMAEEIRKNHPNKVKFLAKEQKEGSVKDPDVVYIVMKGDTDYDGKYTNAKSGQQALGGYTEDGYKMYAIWLALNKEARNKDRRMGLGAMEHLENKVKNTLRKKFNITAKSYKELLKGQGKRTKQVDSAAKKKVAADLFSDSDVDD